jgi:hypothetical protein
MPQEIRQTELRKKTQQLLQGPLKHIRGAALAAALLPLASVAVAPASAQSPCPASGGVCGVVFTDTNVNGIQDVGEPGIAGVTVTVCQLCNGADSYNVYTDANGFYFLLGPGGPTTVAVLIPPGTQASPPNVGNDTFDSDGIPNGAGYSVAQVDANGFATDFGFFTPSNSCPSGLTTGNSTLINNLGAAGPGNFTVLSLGGVGSVININLATVVGNVGLPNFGTLKESAPSSVFGDLIIGSAVTTKGVVGYHGPIIVNDSLLAQAVIDAEAAAAFFASLASTPSVQAQFPANGQITGNLTVTGTPGLNVVHLSNFLLNNGSSSLTLTGPAGTAFVINDSGNFNLHSGNIKVGGGVGPLDVVYNITNPKATVTTMVPTTAVGILLAPDNAINTMDSATFTGEIIGGFEKTIVLMSGSHVTNPCPPQ